MLIPAEWTYKTVTENAVVTITDRLDNYVEKEVYIEDKLTNRQQMQAPKEILMANFMQTAKQIRSDNRPIKIKMIRQEIIWDNFENKQRVLNNEVSASNDAMVAWEENNKK